MKYLQLFEDYYPGPKKGPDKTKEKLTDEQIDYLESWLNEQELIQENYANPDDYMTVTGVTWFDFTDDHRWFISMMNEARLIEATMRAQKKPVSDSQKRRIGPKKSKFIEVVMMPEIQGGGEVITGYNLEFASHGWPASRSEDLWSYDFKNPR